ncbi:MAG TPA: hypothetical protein VJV04_05775 [Nitrospiraceae bacterium]|nr:hypothetical protein [Nitrospiraceae bacterium]
MAPACGTILKGADEVNEWKEDGTLPSRLRLRYTSVVRGFPRVSADRPPGSVLMSHLAVALLLISLSGCSGASKIFNRFSEPDGYWLPLTVDLRLDPSVADAALEYTDACGQRQMLPIGERLTTSLKKDLGLVFQRIQMPSAGQKADGAVDVALGLKETDLFIPRQTSKTYPATVIVGATISYADANGNVLYTKNLRAESHGTVETEGQGCEVKGFGAVANEAVTLLTQGLKKHLGTSTKIRDAAQHKQPTGEPSVALVPSVAAPAEAAATPVTPASMPFPLYPNALAYRVLLREGHADERLESGEKVTMEVEVSNTGTIAAKEVVVRFSGTPVLVEQFANPVPVGDLQPNEMKRVVVSARMPPTEAIRQGELILAVEAANGGSPDQKKFPIEWHPRHALLSIPPVDDVDGVFDTAKGLERKKTVGIAIGISTFRHATLSPVPFAAHDAEVMADYFKQLSGIPSAQVQLLTDEHALKDDLIEVFEEWLPRHAEPGGEVLIFIASRALVNPSTGAVSFIPHEADPASPLRLMSLRRLYDALARLPIQRAVLMMDLTWTSSGGEPSADGKEPMWDAIPTGLRGEKLLQIIGTTGHEQAHPYEEGRHGLFTYFLLKGLRGAADRDQNGIVAVGELCGYVREHVTVTAKEKYQQAQHPMCIPPLTAASKSAVMPLSQTK